MEEEILILKQQLAEAKQLLALWRSKEVLPDLWSDLVKRTDEILNDFS
jgi:hypothetical protein